MNDVLLTLFNTISDDINLFLVIETRIASTFMVLFFLRRDWVPVRVLLGLSMVLSYFILNIIDLSLLQTINNLPKLIIGMVSQFVLGVITGIILNIFAEFFVGFGQIISMQSGLGFVNFYVPRVGNISPLTQFFILLAIVIFFELNGHLVLIKTIVQSFKVMPVIPKFNGQILFKILSYSAVLFQGMVMLSLSVIFSIMLANITLAILTKFTPQLNIFSIGINISMLLCFFILYISFDFIVENGTILCNQLLSYVSKIYL